MLKAFEILLFFVFLSLNIGFFTNGNMKIFLKNFKIILLHGCIFL